MLRPLDGPSVQGSLSVTTGTVQEAKIGASPLEGRSAITLKSDQKLYIYFGDDTAAAPSAGTVSSGGIALEKNQLSTFEATDRQPVYLLAVSVTADVRLAERS